MTDTTPAPRDLRVSEIQVGSNVRGEDLGDVAGLARSIESVGLLNPLVVRQLNAATEAVPIGASVELVAGYRRLAAVRRLGWDTVPVTFTVPEDGEGDRLAIQLVENLQREDLDPIAEAEGLAQLAELLGSQKAAAQAVGRSTAHVSKRVKLGRLVPEARALLTGPEPIAIEDAVELAGLPEKIQRRLAGKAEIASPQSFRFAIDSEIKAQARNAESRKAAKAAADEKANRGLEVVAGPDAGRSWKSIEGWNGLSVERDAHAKEPCHRVVVGYLNTWDTEIRSEEFCAEPARHEAEGESPLKVEDKTEIQRDREERQAAHAAEYEANRERWWGVARQAVEDLDRNAALKTLSLYVLGNIIEDDGRQDLRALLEAVGVAGLPEEPESHIADEAWREYAEAVDEKLDSLTIAQTYRAAVLWVLDNSAASPAEWQRERHPSPAIAELLGITER